MNHYLCTAAALLTAALTSACGSADLLGFGNDRPSDIEGAPIRTDSAVYHVRTTEDSHELTIEVTYTNPTGSTVYIPTCHSPHPPVLEKWQEDTWVTAYAPVVPLCLGAPVVIADGDVYAYTYRISAARSANWYPRFEVPEIPGTYRLVWRILGTWTPDGPEPGLGRELPLEQRVSNTFEIVL
jgi:hypothetical protein